MVIELSGVQFGLKLYVWFQKRASSIWNHKYDFRPKLFNTNFDYHFITSILKSLISFETVLVHKAGLQKAENALTLSTKQNDRCNFTKIQWSAKKWVNFIHANVQAVLKSCYCKNSLLQSLILVVWLNNTRPSLLLQLWLRHRVFLGEKNWKYSRCNSVMKQDY